MIKKKTRRIKVSFTAPEKIPREVCFSISTGSGAQVAFGTIIKSPRKWWNFMKKEKRNVESENHLSFGGNFSA